MRGKIIRNNKGEQGEAEGKGEVNDGARRLAGLFSERSGGMCGCVKGNVGNRSE